MGDNTGIAWTDATWNPVISPDGEWAQIPGFPAYCVNRDGVVRSTQAQTPRVLSQIRSASGHLYVFLYRFGRQHKRFVHRLVLQAWAGPCPEGHEARHLNGVPTDNRLANLAWGTRSEQRDDDRRNGVIRRPADTTLSESEVREIREDPRSSREVARAYGVSHTTVQKIRRGERWRAA